jgi:hypothetical protein
MKQRITGNPKGSVLLLERVFGLAKAGTDPRTEFVAGLTTFLTMVYIVFVNPQILGNAGMDKGAVFVATCIAAAVSTLVMALYANYPIALAPGMGLNAFFTFTVVLTMKYTWQQALAAGEIRAGIERVPTDARCPLPGAARTFGKTIESPSRPQSGHSWFRCS